MDVGSLRGRPEGVDTNWSFYGKSLLKREGWDRRWSGRMGVASEWMCSPEKLIIGGGNSRVQALILNGNVLSPNPFPPGAMSI